MANTSYFSAENSWKRLFFITGKTADEFYMDSGIKMNIEQAIWQELKRNGYERIVFFDNDQKLYCYDDESFKLLTKTTKRDAAYCAHRPSGSWQDHSSEISVPVIL